MNNIQISTPARFKEIKSFCIQDQLTGKIARMDSTNIKRSKLNMTCPVPLYFWLYKLHM